MTQVSRIFRLIGIRKVSRGIIEKIYSDLQAPRTRYCCFLRRKVIKSGISIIPLETPI